MATPKITKAEQQIARDNMKRDDPSGSALVQAILSAAPDKVKRRYKKIFGDSLQTINPSALVHVALAQLLMLSLDNDVEVKDKVKLSIGIIESIRKMMEKFELQSAESVSIMLSDFTSTSTADLEDSIEFGK